MDNQTKVCPSCGTENQQQFAYCRMCGTPLAPSTGAQPNNTAHSGYYEPDTVAGHPTPVVRAFVGMTSSGNKIINKFTDMEMSRSNVSWCWPVFLLAVLLGPMYTAIWFFYRKMHKTGLFVLLAGALIDLVQMVISFDFTVSFTREFMNIWLATMDSIAAGDTSALNNGLDSLASLPLESSVVDMLTSVISLLSLAGCGVLAVFALGIYKNHTNKKLSDPMTDTANYYRLTNCGGTSAGAAVLSAIGVVVIENIITYIPIIYAMSTSALVI